MFVGVGVAAFFLYDASTYREDLSYGDIQVSELALSPRRGGPKNLPIAEVQIDDDDCAQYEERDLVHAAEGSSRFAGEHQRDEQSPGHADHDEEKYPGLNTTAEGGDH